MKAPRKKSGGAFSSPPEWRARSAIIDPQSSTLLA
jgi:hypothetical protein